jgi:FkbH-like protein
VSTPLPETLQTPFQPPSGGAGDDTLLVIADTVLAPLQRLLAETDPAPVVRARFADYNQVQQILRDRDHPVWGEAGAIGGKEERCGTALVWTTPQRQVAAFQALLEFRPATVDQLLAEVDSFADGVLAAARRVGLLLVVSWCLPPYRRWVQALSLRSGVGAGAALLRMNLRLAERLAEARNIVLLDATYWHATVGRPTYDPKLHALAKVEYSRDLLVRAATEIKAVLRAARGQARKLIICDLDQTLWGGIIGDDGLDQIVLGGHDGIGESYADLQRELRTLKNRGILLAICSKNDRRSALEALERHPAMVLRPNDFAALRISWDDKAAGVGEILRELNLPASAAVFLDDSPSERSRVTQVFPQMLAPELPGDVSQWPALVASLDCFETLSLTAEDATRTEMYQIEAQRQAALEAAGGAKGSLEGWLASLELRVTVRRLERSNLPRAAQLLNKTNQFNMATRRMSESQLWDWCAAPERIALIFEVADRFGEAGVTGLLTATIAGAEARLDDFVMSCRVMGKGVEQAMLAALAAMLAQRGVGVLRATAIPTEKNGPIRTFLAQWVETNTDCVRSGTLVAPAHIRIFNQIK